jgi:hypothetical protein
MDQTTYALFLLTVILGMACLGVVVFGLFITLFVRQGAQFHRIATAEFHAPPAEDFLAAAALRPWAANAFEDLSCRWVGERSRIRRFGRYEGYTRAVIQSLRDPQGPGWIAFTIDSDHRQARTDLIVLKTSAQRLELRVSGPRLSTAMQVAASVDGREWGTIAVTWPRFEYRGADQAAQALWAPAIRPKVFYAVTAVSVADPVYDPLMVNGRMVAALADMWIRNPRPQPPKPFPPALQAVCGDLSADEQGILLMMLGMSLYYHSLRSWSAHFNDATPDW